MYLDYFRNIDLFHQGLYKLRISIGKGENCSYPYNMVSRYSSQVCVDPHNITPTVLEESSVDSKSFLVRYFDEIVRIEEFFLFRSEIELESSPNDSDFTLTIDLLFTDLKGKVSPEEALEAAKLPLTFETVSTSKFTLKFPGTFQSTYLPIVFDDNHCCLIASTLHYLLLDYKFRPMFLCRTQDVSESMASTLFRSHHKSGREYIGSSQTDSTYNKFMTPLCKTYAKLREHYLTVLGKCLTESQRHLLQLYYVPPVLSLPGSPVQILAPLKVNIESISTGTVNESDEDSVSDERPGHVHRFSQRVASHDAKKIATCMMAELNMVSGQIFQLWHRLHEIVPSCAESLLQMLKEKHNICQRQELSAGHIRKVMRSGDIGLVVDVSKGEVSKSIAENKRKLNQDAPAKAHSVFEEKSVVSCEKRPILIEEFCIHDRSLPAGPMEMCGTRSNLFSRDFRRRETSTHLVVLVHGFQGSSADMRIIKNLLYINFPNSVYLCSSYNENDTESSVYALGEKLAKEVNDHLKDNCVMQLGRLSFIGHSLGGLIIRAALPLLEEFSEKMHLFMTFSSPHLGIIEGCSKLIRAGLWVLNNFKKGESLKQLSFADSLKMEECALYKLSNEKGCEWFNHMVVISSPQDLYSPHYSARIETHQELQKYGNNGKYLQKMAKNILQGRERIHRFDVDFNLPANNFDNWIGRAGHIEFLENHTFINTLIFLHPEFFE